MDERHYEATADGDAAYMQFHGWVLECLWCDHETRGRTKTEALEKLQKHYDAETGGRITLYARGAT